MNSDPLEPITKIAERLQEKAQELGLEMVHFMVVPDTSGHGNHAVQAVFALPESMTLEPEIEEEELPPELAPVPELDDELAGIWAATADDEEEQIRLARERAEQEKMDEDAQRLIALRSKLVRNDKGFLDD